MSKIEETKWIGPLKFYSGHDIATIRPTFHDLHRMLFQEPKESTKTIRQKYSHRYFLQNMIPGGFFNEKYNKLTRINTIFISHFRVFHEVALIDIPSNLDL